MRGGDEFQPSYCSQLHEFSQFFSTYLRKKLKISCESVVNKPNDLSKAHSDVRKQQIPTTGFCTFVTTALIMDLSGISC